MRREFNKSKINKIIDFMKKYQNQIFYLFFIIIIIAFILSLVYPKMSSFFHFLVYIFFINYIILKFLGFKIDIFSKNKEKSIKKISFFNTTTIQIFIILFSTIIIFYNSQYYKKIKQNWEKNKIVQKLKNTINTKIEKKKKMVKKDKEDFYEEDFIEDNFYEESFEEKIARLEKEEKKKKEKIKKDKEKKKKIEKKKKQEKIKNYKFQKNLYPWTKNEVEEIKILQEKLKKLKYYNGKIDGIYNENLKNSIKKFLIEKCSWPKTTKGYFGPQARECINSLSPKSSLPKREKGAK